MNNQSKIIAVAAKICGLKDPAAITAAILGGASYIGLNFYPPSPRAVTPSQARELAALMPPAVKTDLTADLPDDGDFKLITTDELVDSTIAKLRGGAAEIRPGQANQLHWMSRIAPAFINDQIAKASAQFIPQ